MTMTCNMCEKTATERINIPGYGYQEYCTEHAQGIMERASDIGMGLGIVE